LAGRLRRSLKLVLVAIALLVAAIVFGFVPLDVSFARERIARGVLESTGIVVNFQGSILLRLGPSPQLSTGRFSLKNPAAAELELLRMDSLKAGLRLLPLLSGKVLLRGITVTNARMDICGTWPQKKAGQNKTDSSKPPTPSPAKGTESVFSFDSLDVNPIEVHCSNEQRQLAMLPLVLELRIEAAPDSPLSLELIGETDLGELKVQASAGSLAELFSDPEAFPVELDLGLATSRLNVNGDLSRPLSAPRLLADTRIEIPNLTEWLDLPDNHQLKLPDLQASTQLDWNGSELILEDLEGALGADHFSARAKANWAGTRPRYDLLFEAPRVDLSVFQKTNAPPSAMEHVDLAPVFAQLARFDSTIQLKIGKLRGLALPTEDIQLDLMLENSRLSLEAVTARISDIPVQAQAQLDLNDACPQLTAHVEVSDVNTADIASQLKKDWPLSVQLDKASMDSTSCGSDTQAHRDSIKTDFLFADLRYFLNGRQGPLLLKQASLSISNQAPGRLDLEGLLHEQNFTAAIELAALDDVYSTQAWPIKVDLHSANAHMILDGQAVLAGEEISLNANVSLDAPQAGRALQWAGLNPHSNLPLKASSSVSLSGKAIALDQINVQLGSSNVSGSMGHTVSGDESAATVFLRSDLLDLKEIRGLWLPKPSDSAADQPADGEVQQPSLFADTPLAGILNSVDLDLEIARIRNGTLDMSEIALDAGIHHGLIDNASMSMKLEEIPLRGVLDADFQAKPWKLAYEFGARDIDIGRLLERLEFAQANDMTADSIDAQLSTSGQDLGSMALNVDFDIEVKNFYWASQDPSGVTKHSFELEHLALNLGPEKAITWQTRGRYNGAAINARVHSPSLKTTIDRNAPLPLVVIAGSGRDVFKISTQFDRSFDSKLQAALVISGQKMESEEYDLSALPDILQDYELQSSLTLIPGQIALDDIRIKVGSSQLNGSFHLEDHADARSVTLKLHGPQVETDDFVNLAEEWRGMDRSEQPADSGETTDENDESYEGMFQLLNGQIKAIRTSRKFDIRLDVDNLYASGEPLGDAHFGLSMDHDHFTLRPITMALPGGVVEADYSVEEKNGRAQASLNIDIEELEYSGLLRLLSPETPNAGKIYLMASIQAEAADIPSLVANSNGKFDLVVFPEDIGAEVLDLWTANLVLALLPVSLGEKAPKQINCIVARMELEDGIMKPKLAFMDTTDVIVRGRGEIDMVNRNLDLLIAPQVKTEKFFSISAPIAVTGPFEDFNTGLAPGSFMTTMFRWFYGIIYVPFKWLTGEKFPADGIETCYKAMDWELPATDTP
jgi:uncharacterized protein involved in outer membrane biogenesis